jgi:predicted O-methyltransferase YrrM
MTEASAEGRKRTRRAFNADFKLEAVRLLGERRVLGVSLAQVGRELGVRPDLLRKWVRLEKRWLARKLAREEGYSFTTDYVSTHVPNWKRLLEDYRDRPAVRMLEIGSYEGRSAIWFLANVLTHATASLVCIDIFTRPAYALRFDHNIRVSGVGHKVAKLKGSSQDILRRLPHDHFDLIYIDGWHEAAYVLKDAVMSWHRLKPGGVMILDDYLWDLYKPARDRPQIAIDIFLESFEGKYEVLLKDYQVAIRKHAIAGGAEGRAHVTDSMPRHLGPVAP